MTRLSPGMVAGRGLWLAASCLWRDTLSPAQEPIDRVHPRGSGSRAVPVMTMRVRLTRCDPSAEQVLVHWRRGGEGLGGAVVRGEFLP